MALDPFAPIRLGLRIGIGLVRFELRVVEKLLGLNGGPEDPVPPRAAQPPAPPPRRAAVAEPPPAPIAEPRIRTVPEPEPPSHIDTEPELVAEFAELGAEEGAGAELHVDEPWDGYRKMRVADIQERVTIAGPEELAVIQLYESMHRARRSILGAVERRTKQLANAPR